MQEQKNLMAFLQPEALAAHDLVIASGAKARGALVYRVSYRLRRSIKSNYVCN